MKDPILPHLKFLRASFSSILQQALDQPAAMRAAAAGRLLDRMIVERTLLTRFRQEFYEGVLNILPDLRAALLSSPQHAISSDSLRQLEVMGRAGDVERFSAFMQIAQKIQPALLRAADPEAAVLCKAMLRLESDYGQKFADAVASSPPTEANADEPSSLASNVRRFDQGKLRDFLCRTFPRESELNIVRCSFLSGGYSKLTMCIELSGVHSMPAQIVLRGDSSTIYSGCSVVDEYRLLRVLHENGICVPRPLALDKSTAVMGAPFILVEKVPGTSVGHMLSLPRANPSICKDVATQLARIQRVSPERFLPCFGAPGVLASERIRTLIDEDFAVWRALNMPSPVFETAFEWLRGNVSVNDRGPPVLVHGDYGLQNILISGDKVSAVLDWEFAYIGNSSYDLGYFYDQAESLSSWDDFLRAYSDAGGVSTDERQINYSILLAATRLGVITARMTGAFVSDADIGNYAASVVGLNYYEEFVRRIARALDRVL